MSHPTKPPLFFFLSDFHQGAVNVILHCAGFLVLGYGLGVRDLSLMFLATFLMEMGHFYNALRGYHRDYALWALPLQYFTWIIIILGSNFVLRYLETHPLKIF